MPKDGSVGERYPREVESDVVFREAGGLSGNSHSTMNSGPRTPKSKPNQKYQAKTFTKEKQLDTLSVLVLYNEYSATQNSTHCLPVPEVKSLHRPF